jgi:hypothetical protein
MNVLLVLLMMSGLLGLIVLAVVITSRIISSKPITCETTCPTPQICDEMGCVEDYVKGKDEPLPRRKLTPHIEKVVKEKTVPKKKPVTKTDEVLVKKGRPRRTKK